MNVCKKGFLYTAYAATEVLTNFNTISKFSGLKIKKQKWELAGIVVKQGVKAAICGVEHDNFLTNAIKILDIYFSYNKKLENENIFFRLCKETSKKL